MSESTHSADTGADVCFEEQCIDLLSKQENTLTNLAKANGVEAPKLARDMLLEFLAFADDHFTPVKIHMVEQRLNEIHLRTSDYEKLLDSQSFGSLKKLIGKTVPDKTEVEEAYQDLKSDYVDLYSEFFQDCIKLFEADSDIRDDFLASVEAFLTELQTNW